MQDDAASRVEFEGDATLHMFQEPNLRALTFAAICGDGCNMLLAFQIPVTHTHTHIYAHTTTKLVDPYAFFLYTCLHEVHNLKKPSAIPAKFC